MVQIYEDAPSFAQQMAAGAGRAVGGGLQAVGQEALKRRENQSLRERGIDVPKNLSDEVRAAFIGEGLKRSMLLKQSEASIPKEFQENKGQPTAQIQTQGSQQAPGQAPETSKTAQRVEIAPEQMGQLAAQRVRDKAARGIESDYQSELNNIRAENQDIQNFRANQQRAGIQAKNSLARVMPDATDEEGAILSGKAEEYMQQGLSESAIEKKLARDADDYKNLVSRIEKSIAPERIGKKVKDAILGTGVQADKAIAHLRLQVKPLLDLGLYDRARNGLAKAGYGPEEREVIVGNLGEETKKTLAAMPKVTGQYRSAGQGVLVKARESMAPGSPQEQQFKENITKALTEDPNTNLILLRKAYMDKGVDWRTVLSAVDELRESGQFSPNRDQDKAIEYLEEPPLHELDKILFGLKLTGK
jgi:hypothetical protein